VKWFLPILVLIATLHAESSLSDLPSKESDHLSKLKSLPDNTWLDLGAPKPDPKFGKARGHSWGARMPYAQDLRGAFLFGEGVHGYVKPDGHYMDDLWFYDVRGHRWICCYPGADTKSLDLTLNAEGLEPIPVASQVHGYQMNTYDPDLKRFMSMPNPHGYEKKALPQREKWLKKPPADAGPWIYESATGKWSRTKTGTAAPESGFGDTFHYLPSIKKAFFSHRSQDAWLYDPAANTWEKLEAKGPPPPFGIDAVSCFDSKRGRLYIGGGSYPVAPEGARGFWVFDLKTKTWSDPKPKGAPCRGSNSFPTKNALMVYDAAHDAVLLLFHSHHDDKPEKLGIYVYDPEANAWSDEPLAIPEKLGRDRNPKNGFLDPALNAIFIHSGGDSRDDGVIWVYRYK